MYPFHPKFGTRVSEEWIRPSMRIMLCLPTLDNPLYDILIPRLRDSWYVSLCPLMADMSILRFFFFVPRATHVTTIYVTRLPDSHSDFA